MALSPPRLDSFWRASDSITRPTPQIVSVDTRDFHHILHRVKCPALASCRSCSFGTALLDVLKADRATSVGQTCGPGMPPLTVPPTRSVFRESTARENCGQNSELRTPRFECFLLKSQKGGGIYCDKLTCVTAIRPEKQTFTSAPC